MPSIQLGGLQTESRNFNSNDIDQVSTTELCRIINNEDASVAAAVEKCIPAIAAAIDALAVRGRLGGRVIYVGAGTSGRLGVLDASEIPPTFSASSKQFVALIAGGDVALRYAQEEAEDDMIAAENDLKALNIDGEIDCLIGIAASGRTPYVLKCLSIAKSLGCTTIGVACCEPSAMAKEGNVDHMISIVTGPEVVTGSTRLKAGTGTKLALNMLSTGVMIKLGKTYGNMMIDLKSTNKKLEQRSRDIMRTICGPFCPPKDEDLDILLADCDGSVKVAVASILLGTSVEKAQERLRDAGGVLARVLKDTKEDLPPQTNGNVVGLEEYVLCVDGGGSKCAAVLLGKEGQIGRGEAGQCNVTSVGVEVAVSTISLAIQRAVDSCLGNQKRPFQSIRFRKVWIGLAGYDRPSVMARVGPLLSTLLNLQLGKELRVSTDIELLVSTIANKDQLDSVVVLVAGTGSIAMSYKRDGGHFRRTGRSGGWGHLLGDDGSGYNVGREGLRLALQAADTITVERNGVPPLINADPLIAKVFEHFGISITGGGLGPAALLDQVYSTEASGNLPMARKIAEVARVVLDVASSSNTARTIIETASRSLVDTLTSLIKKSGLDPSSSSLVLAGGLIQNDTYQKLFIEMLSSDNVKFSHVEAVDNPAMIAANHLFGQV